jgi:hypothetical protein
LKRRYRQVLDAVKEASVPFQLMQNLTSGDESAEDEVNSILEAALSEQTVAKGSVELPAMGAGPVRLAPLKQSENSSPLWENPVLDLGRKEQVAVVEPRSALEYPTHPVERPTEGGKCVKLVYEHLIKADLQEGARNVQAGYESDLSDGDDDMFKDFDPEDLQDYGFQVYRRELTTYDAEEGFGIENEEWFSCGEIFTDLKEANGEARMEALTILPGSHFFADPKDTNLQMWQEKPDGLQGSNEGLQHCKVIHPKHGECQTKVKKVLQLPKARVAPPTRKEIHMERKDRVVWFILRRFTIQPPANEDDLFGEDVAEARVIVEGDSDPYSDSDLTNERAAQAFVDSTFKSMSRSLDSRSEEKKARVEGYLAGILAGEMFAAEGEISGDMEGFGEMRKKYGVEHGSKVTLKVEIKSGLLHGPRN